MKNKNSKNFNNDDCYNLGEIYLKIFSSINESDIFMNEFIKKEMNLTNDFYKNEIFYNEKTENILFRDLEIENLLVINTIYHSILFEIPKKKYVNFINKV